MVFEWTGDLEDDCVCRVGPLMAHVECMASASDPSDPDFDPLNDVTHEIWHAMVNISRPPGELDWKRDVLFHPDDRDIRFLSGDGARWLCELVMRDWLARNPQ